MKHYDNSREGNDCWFNEHWYWMPQFDVAVRLQRVEGWGDNDLRTTTCETIDDEMPEEVKEWFK